MAELEHIFGARDHALIRQRSLVISDLPCDDSPSVNRPQFRVSLPQTIFPKMKWSTVATSVSAQGRALETTKVRETPDADPSRDMLDVQPHAQIVDDSSSVFNQPQNLENDVLTADEVATDKVGDKMEPLFHTEGESP